MEDDIGEKSEINRICKFCKREFHWRALWIHEKACLEIQSKKNIENGKSNEKFLVNGESLPSDLSIYKIPAPAPDVISRKIALCKNCGCYSENFQQCCSKKVIAKNNTIMTQKVLSDDLPKNEKLPDHIIVLDAIVNGKKAKYWCKLCQTSVIENYLNMHIGSKMHSGKIREIEEKKMTSKGESLPYKMENIKGNISILYARDKQYQKYRCAQCTMNIFGSKSGHLTLRSYM